MADPREVRQVQEPERLRFLHREVLAASFPAEEVGTADDLVDAVAAGRMSVWSLVQDGVDVGAAVVQDEGVPGVCLLAWFAVLPGGRGAGRGSFLLTRLLEALAAAGNTTLLAEIQDPSGPVSDAYGDPAARARFYARFGARALLLPHEQPPMAPGFPSVPLLLVWLPLPGQGGAAPHAEPVVAFLANYRRLAPGSPDVTRLLTLAPGGLVPLGDLSAESFALTRSRARPPA